MVVLAAATGGCSIQKLAMNRVADLLASGESDVFTGESDVDLVGGALPFALKLQESILESVDDNPDLYLSTGQAFTLYARAYVQMPAEMLPDERFDDKAKAQARARRLYLRARGYVLQGLDLRHSGFSRTILEGEQWEQALSEMTVGDAGWLYWAGLAWMGAFSTNTFDLEMLLTVPRAAGMLSRVLELDDAYDDGGVHEFFVSYYGSLPPDMGGSEEKARFHFRRAVEISGGLKASPYVALATTVSVKNQDVDEFRSLLEKALAVDLDAAPELRLANAISQRQAAWLLGHVEDFFLIGGDE